MIPTCNILLNMYMFWKAKRDAKQFCYLHFQLLLCWYEDFDILEVASFLSFFNLDSRSLTYGFCPLSFGASLLSTQHLKQVAIEVLSLWLLPFELWCFIYLWPNILSRLPKMLQCYMQVIFNPIKFTFSGLKNSCILRLFLEFKLFFFLYFMGFDKLV